MAKKRKGKERGGGGGTYNASTSFSSNGKPKCYQTQNHHQKVNQSRTFSFFHLKITNLLSFSSVFEKEIKKRKKERKKEKAKTKCCSAASEARRRTCFVRSRNGKKLKIVGKNRRSLDLF